MNILIATSYPSLPECIGGSQKTADALARLLIERGHRVSWLCGILDLHSKVTLVDAVLGFRNTSVRARTVTKLFGGKAARDTSLGYPAWRARVATDAIEWVLDKAKADIVLVICGKQVPMISGARNAGVPAFLWLHNVEFWDLGGSLSELGGVPCSTNSQFTADRYREAFGIESTVIYPLIDQEKYRTATTKENVTFINPVPEKGVEIAIAVARKCPDISFSFVPSWPLDPYDYAALQKRLAALPNVRLRPRATDMREVYGKCRILLAPSVWQETYGRVASEAQCSGIPVVASNRAGLPESVGAGGILIDPDGPIGGWVEAVRSLWYDETYYAELSAAAHAHVSRRSLNKNYQVDLWEKILFDAIQKGPQPVCSEALALASI